MCVKALDARNRGKAGDVVAGLELAARMHARQGRNAKGVASVSLGVRVGRD